MNAEHGDKADEETKAFRTAIQDAIKRGLIKKPTVTIAVDDAFKKARAEAMARRRELQSEKSS